MTKLIRLLLLVGCCLSTATVAEAQISTSGGIPDETLLNRYGLTLSWWGRSIIDGKRDTVLFVTADEQNIYMQSSSGILTTFNGETGRQLWSTLVGSPDQRGFPATTNDEQLLVTGGMQIYSFNKDTGDLLWQLRSPEHPSASPSINESQVAIGAIDGSVFAFDLRKVRELHDERMLPRWTHLAQMWRFKTPLATVSPPIFTGETIVFASEQGIVYGLFSENKKLKFQFETDVRIETPLGSSREEILIISEDSRLFCINKDNGRTRWTFSSGAPMRSPARVIGQQVFVAPTREGMSCIHLKTGLLLWEQPRAIEFVAASETRVYASDLNGNLLILNRGTGEKIGQLQLRHFNKRINNERTDRIYLANESGMVLAIREIGSEYPSFHLYPERRPILPLLVPEEGEEPPMKDGAVKAVAPADEEAKENPFEN
ncbi:PQQ-like beta-propeller repeat protein [Thalassoglobus polymorphus]|uniref:Outer membrane biogenesis protein BamB n=1 Tax=Thalassoglobus polymorphus TaxID=2527994 RepID=A0A517QPP6_9PLAN|nr:PQQ-like beta-propeller repeat protein [Thalassoglobus polymorphus]QDT33595.1 outer membrane biogenesis protein BamB [Thalassoglobus polymorphus]